MLMVNTNISVNNSYRYATAARSRRCLDGDSLRDRTSPVRAQGINPCRMVLSIHRVRSISLKRSSRSGKQCNRMARSTQINAVLRSIFHLLKLLDIECQSSLPGTSQQTIELEIWQTTCFSSARSPALTKPTLSRYEYSSQGQSQHSRFYLLS